MTTPRDKDPLKYLRITSGDYEEILRFEKFLRLVHECEKAGCTRKEAVRAIYSDVFS